MQPQPRRRLGVGIAVSLAAHVLLVLTFRADSLRELATAAPQKAEALLVWIKPKPQRPVSEQERIVQRRQPETAAPARRAKPTEAESASPERVAEQETTPETTQDTSVPQPIIAVDRTTAPDPFYVQPSPQEKTFDVAAARAAARQVATTADPARADLPVGQFDKERQRVKPDDPVARKIAQAKRANCKDGIPGGLLAPLLLLMDKKDHGCKW